MNDLESKRKREANATIIGIGGALVTILISIGVEDLTNSKGIGFIVGGGMFTIVTIMLLSICNKDNK